MVMACKESFVSRRQIQSYDLLSQIPLQKYPHFCRDLYPSRIQIHHFFTFGPAIGCISLEPPLSILTLFGFYLNITDITAW